MTKAEQAYPAPYSVGGKMHEFRKRYPTARSPSNPLAQEAERASPRLPASKYIGMYVVLIAVTRFGKMAFPEEADCTIGILHLLLLLQVLLLLGVATRISSYKAKLHCRDAWLLRKSSC